MADQNIKDYVVTWITFGFLFFSMITFAAVFMAENNPDGLGDASAKFGVISANLSSNLLQIEADSNAQLNASAIPSSDPAKQDAVAATNSYGFWDSAKSMFSSTKTFMGWMLGTESGSAGNMIIKVFFGLMGLIALFYIFKLGRSLI